MIMRCLLTLLSIFSVFVYVSGDSSDSRDSSDSSESESQVSEQAHWNYNNVLDWAKNYPDCAANDESPINIVTNDAITDESECVSQFDWNIDYNHNTFKVINNGHSLQLIAVEPNHYSIWPLRRVRRLKKLEYISLNSNYNTIARFPDYFALPESEHNTFCLHSIHFHWGQTSQYGSEHTIDDEYFPLEAHFVHYACDAMTLEQALNEYTKQKDPYTLAVVAVLFEVYETDNPGFDSILDRKVLKKILFPDDVATNNVTEGMFVIDTLNLEDIIPQNIATEGYYAYQGSLTTPPCTDVVRWHVMNARGKISEAQLQKMRTLYDADGEAIAPNYRDIQHNVNGVWSCIDRSDTKGISIFSPLVEAEIQHASLSTVSLVIIGVGCTIFILLMCVVCCYANNETIGIIGSDCKGGHMLFQNEIEDNISDTETILESDVLINDVLSCIS